MQRYQYINNLYFSLLGGFLSGGAFVLDPIFTIYWRVWRYQRGNQKPYIEEILLKVALNTITPTYFVILSICNVISCSHYVLSNYIASNCVIIWLLAIYFLGCILCLKQWIRISHHDTTDSLEACPKVVT